MNRKGYIYLPGGNPNGAFEAAALEIAKRAMPYMGKYNELLRKNSKPYSSVARGLSEDLGVAITTDNLFFGHGVKEAMHLSARYIDWLCRDLEKLIRKAGHEPPKFKFLIRSPTYKHVFAQFQGFKSFECKFVSSYSQHGLSEGHGRLDHANLLPELEYENPLLNPYRNFEYIVGYLDINPCNPTGYVRGPRETLEIALSLALVRASNLNYLEKILGYPPFFKREPFVLIEDHIYRGLEYDGIKTMGFCQLGKHWQEVTQTIFGVAKYGLVGMRGSVTVAPKFDIGFLQENFNHQNSDVSPFSVLSCEYMFGDNPEDKTARKQYLKKKTQEYEKNALISTAIIDGKARDFLSPSEYEQASTWLMKYGSLSENETHKLLEAGIKGIDVVSLPRAGFFLLLNYDDLIDYADDEKRYESQKIAKFIREVSYHQLSMYVGEAEYMGLNNEYDTVIRFTVALSPRDLIKGLLGLRKLSALMDKIGPINSDNIPDVRNPFAPCAKLAGLAS